MSQREDALRSGKVEHYKTGTRTIALYWEAHTMVTYPHSRHGEPIQTVVHSFTVDISGDWRIPDQRHRFDTLSLADALIFKMRDKDAVDLAMEAFGIVVEPGDD